MRVPSLYVIPIDRPETIDSSFAVVTGPGKLAGRRLPVRRITRPAVRVLRHRKEATGDSPLFFDFTAVGKYRHLRGIRRRGVASVRKRAEGLVGD